MDQMNWYTETGRKLSISF